MICRRNDSDFKTEKDITSHGLLRDPNPYKYQMICTRND